MKKRQLSILLALGMVAAMLPTAVFAQTNGTLGSMVDSGIAVDSGKQCSCTVPCAEGSRSPDCPACAETPAACEGKAAMLTAAPASSAIENLIFYIDKPVEYRVEFSKAITLVGFLKDSVSSLREYGLTVANEVFDENSVRTVYATDGGGLLLQGSPTRVGTIEIDFISLAGDQVSERGTFLITIEAACITVGTSETADCNTMADALGTVEDGGTIQLVTDLQESIGITDLYNPSSLSFTLDLNGHKLEGDDPFRSTITYNCPGTLTIKDSKGGGSITSTVNNTILVGSEATLVLKGGTVMVEVPNDEDNMYSAILNFGTVTVNGGEVVAKANWNCAIANSNILNIKAGAVSAADGAHYAVRNDGSLKLTGGRVEADEIKGSAIYNYDAGVITVAGGIISAANSSSAIENSETGGAINITGGTVTASGTTPCVLENPSNSAVRISPDAVIEPEGAMTPLTALLAVVNSTAKLEEGKASYRLNKPVPSNVLIYPTATGDTLASEILAEVKGDLLVLSGSGLKAGNRYYAAAYDRANGKGSSKNRLVLTVSNAAALGGDGGSDGDDSSSGIGGSGQNTTTTPGGNTLDASSTVQAAIAKAMSSGTANTNTTVSFKNYQAVTQQGLKSIADKISAANSTGAKLNPVVNFDTVKGNMVVSRITADPTKLAAAIPEATALSLGLHIDQQNDKAVQQVADLFERNFDNKVVAFVFDQKSPLPVNVGVAAKLDLSPLNTSSLVFYAYDNTKNTYARVVASSYFIDANGYTHFTTPMGGSVVVTDSTLIKK